MFTTLKIWTLLFCLSSVYAFEEDESFMAMQEEQELSVALEKEEPVLSEEEVFDAPLDELPINQEPVNIESEVMPEKASDAPLDDFVDPYLEEDQKEVIQHMYQNEAPTKHLEEVNKTTAQEAPIKKTVEKKEKLTTKDIIATEPDPILDLNITM